ncbi:MAG: hypothetical protein ACI8T1_005088 [Verrucomicrobiales bacterium]|jgi:hypothetical protein
MEMDIRLASFSPRSLAPIPATVTLKGDVPLTEGKLSIRLKQGFKALIDYESDPLIVTSEPREIQPMLPAMVIGDMTETQATWELVFQSETERFVREDLIISIPNILQVSAVVAVVHPEGSDPDESLAELIRGYTLEEMMGFAAGGKNDMGSLRVFTVQARLRPEQLSTTAVSYCGYDIFVMSPEGFAMMSEGQLDALSLWIRAGGSALITTDPDQPMVSNSPVAPFLESIASEVQALTIVEPEDQEALGIKLTCHQWDLGRIALLHNLDMKAALEELVWSKLFSFLWKVRDLEAVDWALEGANLQAVSKSQGLEAAQWSQAARQRVFRELMPQDTQLLTGFQFACIMEPFLLLVGPVEFFLLRRTRRRWLTWFTFPATILALTWGLFVLADTLPGKTTVNNLTLVDLGESGEGVRSCEVTLTFSRSSGTVISDRQRTLVSSVHQHTPSA